MHVVQPLALPSAPEAPPHPWRELSFERCVPRETVHKSATAEVLLTDAARLDADRFAVAAVWRRDNFLGHLDDRVCDPVLLAETARQAAIHLSHRFHGIAHGHPFVLNELAVELDEDLAPLTAMPHPLVLDTWCRRTAPNPRRTCLELDADVRTEHGRVGRARVRWEVMEPRRYTLLRKRGAPETGVPGAAAPAGAVPLAPARVNQRRHRDVLLASDATRSDRWWLRLDRDHPVLFDHPSDHIPGMALVEAFRQAVVAAAEDVCGARARDVAPRVRSLVTRFTSFGELHLPVSLTVERAEGSADGGRESVLVVRAVQADRELASARVVCAVPSADRRYTGAAC